MHADHLQRIDSLWAALRQSLDHRDTRFAIETLRAEYERAEQEAHAFGLGEGFARGHDRGWQEGYEAGRREGRADAAHQLSMRFVDAAAAIVQENEQPTEGEAASADDRQLLQLADLEAHIRDGKAPIH